MNVTAAIDSTAARRTLLGSLELAVSLRGDRPAVRFTEGGDHSATELLAQAGRFA